MQSPTNHRYADTNGIRLHYVVRGAGKPVVMLHGFPETHRSWDLQQEALLAAGYQTYCVDLRGYGRSDRPRVGYDLRNLAQDIAGLIRKLDVGAVPVIGHDWGGAVTWELASRGSDLVQRAIILDCPHPAIMARALRSNPRQIRRSWYMFFFQLPRLPERWLSAGGGRNLASMFRQGPLRAGVAEIVEAQRQALLAPGALGPALAYYRCAFRQDAPALISGKLSKPYARIPCPITLVWGEEDSCLGTELIHGTSRHTSELDVTLVPDAGHFVHQERPDIVNPLLLRALSGADSAGPNSEKSPTRSESP